MIRRFLLFGGDLYYPEGGWDDLHGSYSSFEEARIAEKKENFGWAHIIDTKEWVRYEC